MSKAYINRRGRKVKVIYNLYGSWKVSSSDIWYATKEEAEADLARRAKRYGWTEVES